MQTNNLTLKPIKSAAILAVMVLLFAGMSPATTTGNNAQDLTFRLINVERRLDQMQIRMDALERSLQSQATTSPGSSNIMTQALMELQRTQLSISQQLVTMQKQMLDMKKEIDRQAGHENDQKKDTDKKDTPQQETKPKVQPKKPQSN